MKKFFSIGLTVLLGVSLFLTGCPTDSDDYDPPPGNWYDGLGSIGTGDGDTYTVSASKTLSTSFTLPEGKTLVIGPEATLTIAAGVTLTVNGTVTGTLAGTNGTSKLVVGAKGVVPGVTAGTTYLWNAGWFDEEEVKEGAKDLTEALEELEEGAAEADADDPTKINLKKDVAIDDASELEIPAGITLAVPTGKKLTVADGATYSGTIAVTDGGTLTDSTKRTKVSEQKASYSFGGLAAGGSVTIAKGGTLEVNASTSDTPSLRTLVGSGDTAFISLGGTDSTVTLTKDEGTEAKPNIITIGGTGAVINGVATGGNEQNPTYSPLSIYKGEQLVIAGNVETSAGVQANGEIGKSNIILADATNPATYGVGGSVKITGTLTIKAYSHLQGGDIFKNAVAAGSTGTIVVKSHGGIVQTGQWGKHLVVNAEWGEADNNADNSRFVWNSESTDLTVDFTAKKITYPGAKNTHQDAATPAELGISGWTEVTP